MPTTPALSSWRSGCAPTAASNAVDGLRYFVGGHPIPNEASLQAGRAILEELQSCDERTLVFFLLSGGGSALVELPIDPAQTLEDVQGLYSALVTCGAPIKPRRSPVAVPAPTSIKRNCSRSRVARNRRAGGERGPDLFDVNDDV